MRRTSTIDSGTALGWLATVVLFATGIGLALIGLVIGTTTLPEIGLIVLLFGCSAVCLSAGAAGSFFLLRPA
ncbi:hypothetical protein [Leifsonia shinshuensis]|uniref:hypothetical protein n=1 Tax=Leifsonia shinshuensis TaxID=150026 RepID=UPI00285EF6E2|nr:hypothetical protein [Leifsonia shinshuensis]MDR6972200.1 hypothetical protein [Leifsonia shinshuensis]